MSIQRLRAGVDGDGKISRGTMSSRALAQCVSYDLGGEHSTETYGSYVGRVQNPQRQLDPDLEPTRIPNARLRYGAPLTGVATGAWRAPAHVAIAFTIETNDRRAGRAGEGAPWTCGSRSSAKRPTFPRNRPMKVLTIRRACATCYCRSWNARFRQARTDWSRARTRDAPHLGSYCAHVVELSVAPGHEKRVTIHKSCRLAMSASRSICRCSKRRCTAASSTASACVTARCRPRGRATSRTSAITA